MKIENQNLSMNAVAWVRMIFLGLLVQGTFTAGAQEIQPNPACGVMKGRADEAFRQCLSKIKANAATKTVQAAVKRCEKTHTTSYSRVEKSYGSSCEGTQNRTEAKAEGFYRVNQQRQAQGVARMLTATPGTDVLVWAYPAWADDQSTMQNIFSKAQSVYNPQLKNNGYQPLVGMAVPVIGYNSNPNLVTSSVNDQNCPYAQTITPNTYLPGLKGILGTGGIDTLIGIANIAPFKKSDGTIVNVWTGQTSAQIVNCLNNFNGYITGLVIDDEDNQLSTDQRNAILDWCKNTLQNSNGRCGMVLGHGTTTTTGLITPRQDICMDYNQAYPNTTCQRQNSNYSRNIFNEEAPRSNTPLPFSILN